MRQKIYLRRISQLFSIFQISFIFGFFTLFLANHIVNKTDGNGKKPNILFLYVDDLRPDLGCYGETEVITPNIDRLAEQGVLFNRSYCQVPICHASRASLLSGYRPDHAKIYNLKSLEDLIPDALTINRHFENNGYEIWANGKIYHHKEDVKAQFGDKYINTDQGWIGRGYVTEESERIVNEYEELFPKLRNGKDSEGRGPAYEAGDVSDNKYWDGVRTDKMIEKLENLKDNESPFLLMVGYRKPHLPFNAPKKYWDIYSRDKLKLADNPFLPKNATKFTPYNFPELRNYYGIPKNEEVLPDDLALSLIHGYYACISYVDAQIGKLLETLERLEMRENTIIILVGDHGWKLGEHGMWCKHTTFELDARVPMIITIPGMKYAGSKTDALTESVDIYPTLCELTGIEKPEHLQGNSLVPILNNPDLKWKEAAFTQWPRDNKKDPDRVITGYSMRTNRYRYTEWIHNESGEIKARELYDQKYDPDENSNIADYGEYNALVNMLSKMLNKGQGWKNIQPKR